MDIFTVMWILWGLSFVGVEGVAILNDRADDTLSEHLREWFRTDKKRGRTVWLGLSGVFFAWFVTHIAVAGSI